MPEAQVAVAEPAPAVAAVVSEPAAVVAEPLAAPAAEGAVSEEAPPTEAAPAPAETPAETVEAQAGETAAQPAVEAKPEAEKPATPQEAEAPAIPTYETWNIPEGMTVQEPQIGALNNIFGKHGVSQAGGQEIIDFGGQIIKQTEEAMTQRQLDDFATTRQGWVEQTKTEFGNRYSTMLNDAKSAVAAALPKGADREAFEGAIRATGAGDHPAIIRAWAAVGKLLRERAAPGPSTPATETLSPADKRYGARART